MTEDVQERVEKQFYVYIFRSLKNEKTRYYWHKGRKEQNEILMDIEEPYLESMIYMEKAFEYSGYLAAQSSLWGIQDEYLFDALMYLSEENRKIIILAYFFSLTDSEIGRLINKGRSTVAYRRSKAIDTMRNYMGGHNGEKRM